MTIKTLLSAAAIAVLPAVSFAMCSGEKHQATTCADGTQYDAETGTCKVVTG